MKYKRTIVAPRNVNSIVVNFNSTNSEHNMSLRHCCIVPCYRGWCTQLNSSAALPGVTTTHTPSEKMLYIYGFVRGSPPAKPERWTRTRSLPSSTKSTMNIKVGSRASITLSSTKIYPWRVSAGTRRVTGGVPSNFLAYTSRPRPPLRR